VPTEPAVPDPIESGEPEEPAVDVVVGELGPVEFVPAEVVVVVV
jgi:hypothetical protein